MKLAAAMKYGGELIHAAECDYNSFKELVPLCPNCKEPVYLRTGGSRLSVKGKEYKVGPHWCHFQGTSAEQVASCESRVNGYSEKDKQRIASQARGQRLKLLQRWFWRLYIGSIESLTGAFEGDVYDDVAEALKTFKSEIHDHSNSSTYDDILTEVRRILLHTANTFASSSDANMPAAMADLMIKGLALNSSVKETWLSSTEKYYEQASNISSVMQSKLATEALFFLSSKSQSQTLFDLVALRLLDIPDEIQDEMDKISSSEHWKFFACFAAFAIISQVAVIPWASEFQRLEAEAKQQRGAA